MREIQKDRHMENTNNIPEDMWVVVEDLTEEQAAKREWNERRDKLFEQMRREDK